jgi:hypothetical protein
LSVSNSHCSVCWFCSTMSTSAFHILTTVCQYLTLNSLLVLCHYVLCLSLPRTEPSFGPMSLYPQLSSRDCPLSVRTSHCTDFWFCFNMSTALFCSLSTVCQYLTLYRLLFLCQYVHCSLLQLVHCLSLPHNVPSVGSLSIFLLLFSTFCPQSVGTLHCTVC